MGQCAPHRFQTLFMTERRNDSVDQVSSCIFEGAGGVAFRVANDHPTRRVRRLRGNPGQLKGEGIRQTHVPVIAPDENRCFRRQGVDQLAGRNLVGRPFRFIPVAALYPLALGNPLGAFADPAGKFLRTRGVVQLDRVQLQPSRNKMHMGIVETRHQTATRRVNNLSVRAPPGGNVGVGANRNDAFAQHGDGLGRGH